MPDRRMLNMTIGMGIAAGVLTLGMVWACAEATGHFMEYMDHSPTAQYRVGLFGRFAWIPAVFVPLCIIIRRRRQQGAADDM